MSATLSQPDFAVVTSYAEVQAAPRANLLAVPDPSICADAGETRAQALRVRRLADAARDEIERAMEAHKRPALTFSGGKDSLACLYLLRPWWDRVTVMWANPGDPYPELVEQMQRVRELVPHFVEIAGPGHVLRHGALQTFPADMVPLSATPFGRTIERATGRFQMHSYLECCTFNWWLPLHNKVNELGVDLMIRGDREDEQYRVPIHSGMRNQNGGTYLLPVQDWAAADVFAYLRAEGVEIPRWYAYGASSPDCLHCTAWTGDGAGRWRYLRAFHPQAAAEVRSRMLLMQTEQQRVADQLANAIEALEPIDGESANDEATPPARGPATKRG
jgi:3'-phosphoadenosine 5'-phosphosulfate sulfotransferase (PAPS reductase)/FAD synthetase